MSPNNTPLLPLAVDPDQIVTLTLEPAAGKPVVVLDQELIQRLEATMKTVPKSARGFVLASNSRVFIAGADLKAISELDDDQLHKYLQYASSVFAMVSDLPCPSVAAINGAALGGGLELAMHCDGLVATPPAPGKDGTIKPYPVGLPEAGLSICPGWGGTNLLPARIEPSLAIMVTATGKPLTFDEARAAGLFDEVAPSPTAESLLSTAKSWLKKQPQKTTAQRDGAPSRWIGRTTARFGPAAVLGALDRVRQEVPRTEPALACLECVDVGLARGWQAALDREQKQLVRLRNQPAGKAAIAAFFAKK